jgi:hypothetical protein
VIVDRLLLGTYEEKAVFRWWPPQGEAAMTDGFREPLPDLDLRNLARVISVCTLGLWAFAVGLLIGTFLFS